MNKRELKQAILKGRMFTGAVIPMPKGEKVLVSDMLTIIKELEADKNRISVPYLGKLHQVVEMVNGNPP